MRRIDGGLNRAIKRQNRKLAKRPDNAVMLHERALTLRDLGRLDDALRDFSRVMHLLPDEPAVPCNRALVLFALGRYEEAVEDVLTASDRSTGSC